MNKRFSDEEKRLILQRSSGMSVTETCRKSGIHRRTFYKWQKQLSNAAAAERTRPPSERRQTHWKEDQLLLHEIKEKTPHASQFQIVKYLVEVRSLPVTRACRVVKFPRRTWYRWHRIMHVTERTEELAAYCRALVYRMAKRRDVPPAYIVAHVRIKKADEARKEVLRILIHKLGLSRRLVASMFGRDLRRVRKNVLGV